MTHFDPPDAKPGRLRRLLVVLLATSALAVGGYVAGRMLADPSDTRPGRSPDPAPSYGADTPRGREADRSQHRRRHGDARPTDSATPAAGTATDASSPTSPPGTTGATAPSAGPTSGPPSPTSPAPSTGEPTPTEPTDDPSSPILPTDITPPQTTMSGEFPAADAATFTLTADEPATFACSLDGSGYTPCGHVVRYVDLAAGWHTLQVRATDLAGNTDPTPAETAWHAAKGG